MDRREERESTDLHTQTREQYCIRVHGELLRIPVASFSGEIFQHLRETFSSEVCDRVESAHEVDLSFRYKEQRYRANFSKQRGDSRSHFASCRNRSGGCRICNCPRV